MLAHFESQAHLAASECRRLQARKGALESSGERLGLYVRNAMNLAGVEKLEGATTTLSLRVATPSVSIANFDSVPG